MANQQQILTLADFDKNLAEMTSADAVQLFKQLIDKSMASGIFKSIDAAAQYYQALKVLDNAVHAPAFPVTDQEQEKKDKEQE